MLILNTSDFAVLFNLYTLRFAPLGVYLFSARFLICSDSDIVFFLRRKFLLNNRRRQINKGMTALIENMGAVIFYIDTPH